MKYDHFWMLPVQGWDKTQNFRFFVVPLHLASCNLSLFSLTSSVQKMVVTCLNWSSRRLILCSISCGVQDSIYIINPTSTTLLFHPLTLRLRHASPLALLTSPVGCLPTTSNLVSTILRRFFPLESPALCKASPSPLTRPRLLLNRLPRVFVCLKTTNCQAAPRVQLKVESWRFALFDPQPLQFFLITVHTELLYFFFSYVLFRLQQFPLRKSPKTHSVSLQPTKTLEVTTSSVSKVSLFYSLCKFPSLAVCGLCLYSIMSVLSYKALKLHNGGNKHFTVFVSRGAVLSLLCMCDFCMIFYMLMTQ